MGLNINLCSVDAHLGWFILETRSAARHATIITERGGGGSGGFGGQDEASVATAVRQVAAPAVQYCASVEPLPFIHLSFHLFSKSQQPPHTRHFIYQSQYLQFNQLL